MLLEFDSYKSFYKKDELRRRVFFQENIKNKNEKPALYLDRDGVIIEDLNFVRDPKDVYLCDGIKSLLKTAFEYNWHIVIVTNQSGISRKIFTWEEFDTVNRRMIELLGLPSLISGIYANGYKDFSNSKNWRKPLPGMILASAKELKINLSKSILIGDRLSDLKAGADAGISKLVHVLTGHGKNERQLIYKSINKSGKFVQKDIKCDIQLLKNLNSFPLDFFKS